MTCSHKVIKNFSDHKTFSLHWCRECGAVKLGQWVYRDCPNGIDFKEGKWKLPKNQIVK